MSPDDIIRNEFTCYYHGDELPASDEWFRKQALPEMARLSAIRLGQRAAGEAERAAIIATLKAMRDDPMHPLHSVLAEDTLISWTDDPADFAIFQDLADAIIARLSPRTA